jgi:peptidyl-prolyl cis-trans isomerase D
MIQIKLRIDRGETTFEEEAKLESDDEASGKQGGELGWVSKGSLVPEFETVAFALDSGTMSDPVKTQFGYHLILSHGRRMEDTVEQVNVSHILRKVMPTMETLDSLERLADTLRSLAVENGLARAVEYDTSLVCDSTGLFKKGDFIAGIGYLFGATSFAFREDVGTVSDVMENTEAFFLMQLKRRTEKGVLGLDEVRGRIRETLADSIALGHARMHLESALGALGTVAGIAALGETDSLIETGVTDTVTRNQYVASIGFDSEPINAAFALPPHARSKVIRSGRAFYAVRPLWYSKVTEIPWNAQDVQQIAYSLSKSEREKAYYAWYLSQKNKAKIEDNLDQYYMD